RAIIPAPPPPMQAQSAAGASAGGNLSGAGGHASRTTGRPRGHGVPGTQRQRRRFAPVPSAVPSGPPARNSRPTMQRLLLPILAAACLVSLGVVLPRVGGGLSALPLAPGDGPRASGNRHLVPAADWFEEIFRGLRGDDPRREDRGNRGRDDWNRGSARTF